MTSTLSKSLSEPEEEPKTQNPGSPTRHLLGMLFITALTALTFSNTLENDYHLDSVYRIQQNSEIDNFWPPGRFFTDTRTGSSIPQIAEYRPLMPLSHSVNSEISRVTGTNKLAGFHVGNILIHLFSTFIAYFLFYELLAFEPVKQRNSTRSLANTHVAMLACLVFAIHPISGSAVNYLAARDVLLMVFFMLSSFLVYTKMRNTGDSITSWSASLILLSLAIFSKQAAITGFGFVFLYELILRGEKLSSKKLWLRTAGFSIPTVAYFLFRKLSPIFDAPQEGLRLPDGISYPLTMLDAHTFYYLRNFFWPFEMRALAKIEMAESLLDGKVLIGLIVVLASLIVAWLFRKKHPVVSFCILNYWLFLALTSSIFPFRYIVNDYRQYLSSVFLSILFTLAVTLILKRKYSALVILALVGYFAISSFFINTHWKTEESFWLQSVKHGADALAHHNYAISIVDDRPEEAEKHYKEALRQYPTHIYANIGLAMLEIRQGENETALGRLRLMVDLNPNWPLPYYWLAVALDSSGETDESIETAMRAAELDPLTLRYQYKAAELLHQAGRRADSIKYFERVVELNPDYRNAEFWLAFAYQKTGQPDLAVTSYKNYISRNPDHVQSHFNLAYGLKQMGNCELAITHFQRVLELQPSYKEAHGHVARCYLSLGDEEKAEYHFSLYRS